jgi:hypothetical protein
MTLEPIPYTSSVVLNSLRADLEARLAEVIAEMSKEPENPDDCWLRPVDLDDEPEQSNICERLFRSLPFRLCDPVDEFRSKMDEVCRAACEETARKECESSKDNPISHWRRFDCVVRENSDKSLFFAIMACIHFGKKDSNLTPPS